MAHFSFCRGEDAVDMINRYLFSVIYDVMGRHLNLSNKLRVMSAEPLLDIRTKSFR
ncbi:MAG: hypothetical protein ACUVWO_10105 [Thermodesulfobacteriota bacterium]